MVLRRPLFFLLLLAIVLLLTSSYAQARAHDRKEVKLAFKTRLRDCSAGPCAGLDDEDPNCAFKCVSLACYNSIYGNDPLEPGEIDARRRRMWQTCAQNEDKVNFKEMRESVKAAAATPATAPAATAAPQPSDGQ